MFALSIASRIKRTYFLLLLSHKAELRTLLFICFTLNGNSRAMQAGVLNLPRILQAAGDKSLKSTFFELANGTKVTHGGYLPQASKIIACVILFGLGTSLERLLLEGGRVEEASSRCQGT